MEKTKNNKNQYFIQYRKANLAQLSVTVSKEIASELKDKLEYDGLTYSQFARSCIKKYLNKKNN